MDYFPVIDLVATGANIQYLRQARGLTVGDLQQYFGFEQPQAIYKWQKGLCLPKVDHLYALARLLSVPMDDILVPCQLELNTGTKKDEAFSPGGKVASPFFMVWLRMRTHSCCSRYSFKKGFNINDISDFSFSLAILY